MLKTLYYFTFKRTGYLSLTSANNFQLLFTKLKRTMPKPGFYAVKYGRTPGIYLSWAECEFQVKGFPNASYKKFPNRSDAEKFIGISTSDSAAVSSIHQNPVPVPSHPLTQNRCLLNAASLACDDFDVPEEMFNSSGFEDFPDLVIPQSKRSTRPYYAVHRGIKPGIYRTWTECEAQIKTMKNASYRKFDNEQEALEYVQTGGIKKATKREICQISYNNDIIKKRRMSDGEVEYVLKNPSDTVVVFTDGASSQNGKKRACAGFGVYWGPNHPLNASKRLTGRQTNNRAEIQAAVYALHQAKQIGAKKVKLYTDSQFLIHAITDWIKKWKKNGWKLVSGEPVVNKDDFLELEAVSKDLEVEWMYVKAHARNHGNDEADRLAVAGARLLMDPANCSSFTKPDIPSEELQPFILTNSNQIDDKIQTLIVPEENVPKKVYYAVYRGRCPGIYKTWTECEAEIKDFLKPCFRKFHSEDEAKEFVKTGKVVKKLNLPQPGMDEFVTVFTDGASSCNGQDDAQAGIGVYWGPGNELNTSMKLPGRQTNNRAEIYAAVHALQQAKRLGIKNLRLYTDSKFVINGITSWIDKWKSNGWKSANGKHVINKDDFVALDTARQGINVDWCYVKGHSDNPGNIEADKLAVAGSRKKLSESVFIN